MFAFFQQIRIQREMEDKEFAVEMEEVRENVENEVEDIDWAHMKIVHHKQKITLHKVTECDEKISNNTMR